MITDANDKDWEDFWNSMKKESGLLQIFIIYGPPQIFMLYGREMEQIEPLTPIPAVYRQIPNRY